MLLNKIYIENIGAYFGFNTIDLSTPSKNKNIVLIGGQNGSGKTTLLNAIKIGLFGSYAYGYKTENEAYFNQIKNLLNRRALKNDEARYRITLEFTEIEDFKQHNYTLYREWFIQSNGLREKMEIIKDGYHLNNSDKEIYQAKLREIMPPQLFDLCLFDGEEISKIINNDLLSNYISELTKVVFNLDLFERLKQDLEFFIENNIDQTRLSNNDQELILIKNKKAETNEKLRTIQDELIKLKNKKSINEDQITALKRDFEVHGGLLKEEREKNLKIINELENERRNITNNIKTFISELLPFYINRDLLQATKEQMDSEETLQIFEFVEKQLNEATIESIVHQLPNIGDKATLSTILREKILNNLKPESNLLLHRASFAQRSQVNDIYNKVKKIDPNYYSSLFNINKEKLLEASELRKKITINDSTQDFNKLLKEIELLTQENQKIDLKINLLTEEELRLKSYISDIDLQITKIQQAIYSQDKTKNAFVISQKMIELANRFNNLQQQKKLQQVEIESTKMLNRLIRKENYISSIKIDHKSFEVNLFDHNGEKMFLKNLSAGEKELLLLSIIWAIFRCSRRRVPFIFDTLLGRLDLTHKKAVLTDLIPSFGEQVLILATDSEVSKENYVFIKDFIAHEYTLVFNTSNQNTSIHPTFFERIRV
jgi:DNA sulfur modification protein DndD